MHHLLVRVAVLLHSFPIDEVDEARLEEVVDGISSILVHGEVVLLWALLQGLVRVDELQPSEQRLVWLVPVPAHNGELSASSFMMNTSLRLRSFVLFILLRKFSSFEYQLIAIKKKTKLFPI